MLRSRSACAYRSTRRTPTELIAAVRRIVAEQPQFGYRRVRIHVEREGERVTASRIDRDYRSLKRGLRKKPWRRLRRQPRSPYVPATAVKQRSSIDFVGDMLVDQRSFRVLGVVDDCARAWMTVDLLTSDQLVRVLDRLKQERGPPASKHAGR